MNLPERVEGQACLSYINRYLGFADKVLYRDWTIPRDNHTYELYLQGQGAHIYSSLVNNTTIWRIPHDVNKRICGVVYDECDDGGYRIAIFGNETIDVSENKGGWVAKNTIVYNASVNYTLNLGEGITSADKDPNWVGYPAYQTDHASGVYTYNYFYIEDELESSSSPNKYYGFDESLDFIPRWHKDEALYLGIWGQGTFLYGGDTSIPLSIDITTNPANTLTYGENVQRTPINLDPDFVGNPLNIASGDIYFWSVGQANKFNSLTPNTFDDINDIPLFELSTASIYEKYNGVCVPYNLILTKNEQAARNYIENGTLPYDAFLFPLDFDNLPRYTGEDDDDGSGAGEDNDSPDSNIPKDNNRSGDTNPNKIPTFLPSMFNGNNLFWLTPADFQLFVNWFWNLGSISGIDDILQKIEGLYNNLSEAVLGVRYYPVDISWIGGAGTPSNIVVGSLELEGSFTTINKTNPPQLRSLGSINIKDKYNSFLDLPPYSSITLYLPYYGFVDLDTDIFSGFTIKIYVAYDYLTLTIQYYIFNVDSNGEHLVNTFLAKMGVNLPLTLQTKNDRDNAVANNIASTVGGLIGAGTTLVTGNPIGLLAGVSAISGATASAPINARGMMGEQGAFYTPSKPALIIRRPTIAKPSNYKTRIGYNSYTYDTLNTVSGFTQVKNPRVNFSGDVKPTKNEIDKIYSYLERGVIL